MLEQSFSTLRESPGGLVKTESWGPTASDSDSEGLVGA